VVDEELEGQPDKAVEPLPEEAREEPAPASAGADVQGAAAEETPAPPRDLGLLKEVLEALVFVHRGVLLPKSVREVLGEEYSAEEIAAGFAALKEDYERRGGAITLVEVAGGYQLGTRPDLGPWIQKLDFYEHHRHLSRPTLETLAIVAYKQPVTRAEIEAIRGVNVERIVRNLIERKLVRILGHKDVPGRPMVLGTTREFLELFGLNSLAGLPPLKDFVAPPSEAGLEEELTEDAGTPGAIGRRETEVGHGAASEAASGEQSPSEVSGETEAEAVDAE